MADVDRILRSATGARGWVTKRINLLAGKVAALEVNLNSSHANGEVANNVQKLEEALEKATETYVEFGVLSEDAGARAQADTACSNMTDAATAAINRAMTVLASSDAAINPPQPQPAAGGGGAGPNVGQGPSIGQHAASLKPNSLLPDGASPAVVLDWKEQFGAFFDHIGAATWPVRSQHALFLNAVDGRVWKAIKRAPTFTNTLPVMPAAAPAGNSVMELLDAHIQAENPIFNRRVNWYQIEQGQHEGAAAFLGRLKDEAALADIESLQYDDNLVLRALTGATDKELACELRKIDNINFAKVQARCTAWDREKKESKATVKPPKAAAATAQKKEEPKKQDAGAATRKDKPVGSIPAALVGLCGKCGDPAHTKEACSRHWKELKCTHCGKLGHLVTVCYTKAREAEKGKAASLQAQPPAQPPAYQENPNQGGDPNARTRRLTACRPTAPTATGGKARVSRMASPKSWTTPKVPLRWRQEQGPPLMAEAILDTGSTVTVMSASFLSKIYAQNSDWELSAANGAAMDVAKEATFMVSRTDGGGPPIGVNVLISSDLATGEILLSWVDQIRLGLLHPEWPNPPPEGSTWTGDDDWSPDSTATARATAAISKNSKEGLALEFPDVLDDNLTPEKRMHGPPLSIQFKEGPITPLHATNVRPVPIHLEGPGRVLVEELVQKGVLKRLDENTATEWLSKGHFVPKPGRPDEARLVTDYVKLNSYIRRPVHPFPSADLVFKLIKQGSKWFCKLDAVHGYFQLPLDEKSQLCTAFLLPWGRFVYTVAPMGLSCSGDWFCQRTDEALAGIDGVVKLVDDILVMGESEEELYTRIREVLERCRHKGIILSRKKMVIGQSVEFAGHVVDEDGVRPAADHIAAINDFPQPSDVPSLRSFMGMCQQVMSFIPDLSHGMKEMRTLLKKGAPWVWTEAMQMEFVEIKAMLSSPLLVKHYDPTRPSTLVTDACEHGLGYMMTQQQADGTTGIITCGSRATSSTEGGYAPIEQEALGVRYACKKCEFYLRGNPHTTTVLTDHRPLEGLFRKDLADVDNARVQRMRDKLVGLDIKVKYLPGKDNVVADALSRAPLFPPETSAEDENARIRSVYAAATMLGVNLATITSGIDNDYRSVIKAWRRRLANPLCLGHAHPAAAYSKVWEELSISPTEDGEEILVYRGDRIVVPVGARQTVLRLLHAGHAGVTKTTQAARQFYYWPGMSKDIDDMVADCVACQSLRPSKPQATVQQASPATFPMEALGADLFHCDGKNWLVVIDRYSGYPFVAEMRSTSATAVLEKLDDWLWNFGLPNVIRTDGGPQFACKEFEDYMADHDIVHEISSPYNPSSNGLAEAGVKQVKMLLKKCIATGSNFHKELHAYRNIPRADGFSPFSMMFRRIGKTLLPALNSAFLTLVDPTAGEEARQAARDRWEKGMEERRRKCEFFPGDKIHIQDPITKKWSADAAIEEKRDTDSYLVRFSDGSMKIRSEKFIRLQKGKQIQKRALSAEQQSVADHEANTTNTDSNILVPPVDPVPVAPRRSPRLHSSYAAAVKSSNNMFGFSPYVSENESKTARIRLTRAKLCSTATASKDPPLKRQKQPTKPPLPPTRSTTRSSGQTGLCRTRKLRSTATSPRTSTRGRSGPFSHSTTRASAYPSALWRSSSLRSPWPTGASTPNAAASSHAATSAPNAEHRRDTARSSSRRRLSTTSRHRRSTNHRSCRCCPRRTSRRPSSTIHTPLSAPRPPRPSTACPSEGTSTLMSPAPPPRPSLRRGPLGRNRGSPDAWRSDTATALGSAAPGNVPPPTSAVSSSWPGQTPPGTPPLAASPTSRTSEGLEEERKMEAILMASN